MHTIEITASPDGEITVETKGIKGKACKDVSAEIEKALGGVTKTTPTAEMYQTAAAKTQIGR